MTLTGYHPSGKASREVRTLSIATRETKEAPYLRGNPIFGSARALRKDPLAFIESALREHGDFVRVRLGPYRVYLLLGPDYVLHLFQKNPANYLKDGYEHNEPLTGRGLLTSEGDFWRRQRRLAQPAFHKERLRGMAEIMTSATGELLDRWREHAKHGPESLPLEITAEMSRLTLGVVSRTLVGTDVGEEAGEFGPALEYTLRYAFRRTGRFFNLPFGFPVPKNLRYMKAIRALDRIVYSLIEGHRPGEDRGDLLSMLMLARDAETGEGMGRKQLRDEVMTFLTAGYETTARALAWTFYLMDQHPEEASRLRGELDEVLGGRVPTFEDLPRLVHAKRFIQESMRLYPPVWGLARRAVGDDVIGGYFVPKGSRLIISAYVTQRHPKLWEEPERFDPGRFSPERSKNRHRYAYFPFGGGPRQCIGRNFAMMEATLVLAMVTRTFKLSLLPGHPVETEPSLTLRPRFGLPMILEEEKF